MVRGLVAAQAPIGWLVPVIVMVLVVVEVMVVVVLVVLVDESAEEEELNRVPVMGSVVVTE